jgi:hypothetical protein
VVLVVGGAVGAAGAALWGPMQGRDEEVES